MEFGFWQLMGVIGAIVVAIVAVRVAVSFDLNKHLEYRKENQLRKLQSICPHTSITRVDSEKFHIRSLFTSPHGTVTWICSQCGIQIFDSSIPERVETEWANDPVGLMKQQEKFNKRAKKYYN